jgi:signal recognition particle receptor subunit beta
MQYNKRDLPNAAPIEDLSRILNYRRRPRVPATATNGFGVFDTLKEVAKLVLQELKRGTR